MLTEVECPWCGERTIAPCSQFDLVEGCWMRDKPDPETTENLENE